MSSPYPRLLADIGGTNARFGWVDGPGAAIAHVHTFACDHFGGVSDAVSAYLARSALPPPAAVAMGVATAVTSDIVSLTNRPSWSFSQRSLVATLGVQRLVVLNDFTALALGLPSVPAHELHQVGSGQAVDGQPIALIGPGTGLGASGLLPHHGSWLPLCGEGGHVTLSPVSDREVAVMGALQRRFGHASAERALSGNGLVWMYEALCGLDGIDGVNVRDLSPGEVCVRGMAGDIQCAEALSLFCNFLGTLAGNLALTLGARGGVYIGGGVAPRLLDLFERSLFRERFEQKGRCRDYLATIPTFIICSPVSPALAGAARALDQHPADMSIS